MTVSITASDKNGTFTLTTTTEVAAAYGFEDNGQWTPDKLLQKATIFFNSGEYYEISIDSGWISEYFNR